MLATAKSQRHRRKERPESGMAQKGVGVGGGGGGGADHRDQQSHRQVEQAPDRRVAGPGG